MTNIIYMQIHTKMYPVEDDIYSILEQAGAVDILGSICDIPVLDIPFLDDRQWQLEALFSRIKHPDWYRAAGEEVAETIKKLIKEVGS